MIKIFINVNGMECTGCETRIKNALMNMEHVTSVDASFETGIVMIDADLKIEEDVLKEKLIDLGFEVKRISYE